MNPESTQPIIVRYPPSPTGKIHIGNIRTLVFNYLFKEKYHGKAILRIEDTDKVRHDPEGEDYIKETLAWLGITYDEFYRQSDRTSIYAQYLNQLVNEGKAYVSNENPSDEDRLEAEAEGKTLRTSVIRFKNPNRVVTFHDEVLGDISVDTSDLGDFVIAKDFDEPLYHFTVVTDDWLMGITHIIRGNDHLSNTPRQILIQEALGAPRPIYVHVPLLVGSDGQKLSKRHGATASLDYRDEGYEPEALLNFLAFLGWNPGTDQEIFTREELIQAFDLSQLQKGHAVFNTEKLDWVNREHIKRLPQEEKEVMMMAHLKHIDDLNVARAKRMMSDLFDRIHTWSDIDRLATSGELDYFFKDPIYEAQGLLWKQSSIEETKNHLVHVYEMLQVYQGEWNRETVQQEIFPYAEAEGKGNVLWPLRFALSGRDKSPDPFMLLYIFGKDESLARIARAIEKLNHTTV